MGEAKYILRFFFEWGGGCLWSGNNAVTQDFGYGPLDLANPCALPLSPEIPEDCRRMAEWHDSSLNWDYPPNPGPWRQAECDRFNNEVAKLFAVICIELGPTFKVINRQPQSVEDPELDTYLANPKGFRRKQP